MVYRTNALPFSRRFAEAQMQVNNGCLDIVEIKTETRITK